ncbi:hypothetical protein EYM_02545 [Ignicoccus islandicus DSM 13165]|uniref:RCK C-terminal domain-containing protein n=1 Tax=Ignicoccus islandicus DSM 13165 TaxID=940295 RepID=A0A0U2MAQ3_9CREN|nr:hypothetical protein EYM_02545 [Ignicoccus islandicus DSM 13165]
MGRGTQCDMLNEYVEEANIAAKYLEEFGEGEDICSYTNIIVCGEDESVIYAVLDIVESAIESECEVPKLVALVHDEEVGRLLSRLGADVVISANILAQIMALLAVHPYAGMFLLNIVTGKMELASKECIERKGCDPYQLAGKDGIPMALLVRGRWEPPIRRMKPGDMLIYIRTKRQATQT